MRVLVIGQGGREHALVKALYFSPTVTEVHALPGNPGISEAICHAVDISNHEEILSLCRRFQFDLVVIGPETPLVQGLSDFLRNAKFQVFGPSQEAANLEGSKIFSKEFMQSAGIPTAPFQVVRSVEDVRKAHKAFTPPYVFKADGLAGGKGVYICPTIEELENVAKDVFDKKILGNAGGQALLEQFNKGYELSFFILTNGRNYVALPLAQDHKKIGEGETGPNTGGMGTVAPIRILDEEYNSIVKKVVEPTVKALQTKNLFYRGVLFIGLIMTDKGPSVLEYNVRFGDPEAQVLLPLLDGDWGQTMLKIAKGEMPNLSWKNIYAACVVLAAEGYPNTVVKGTEIEGDLNMQTTSSYLLHAGTKKEGSRWLVDGGRVLNCVGIGSSLKEAIKKSYEIAEHVHWKGRQMRSDIGKKFL
ncbi:MAG: phosphoribosylamine--glycine ligase [Bdellovibrionaceae bacterium]|nr:phosphoribosylamine--glycine ligase [Pseudobdellovibrionaceae bacterium]